MMESLLSTCLLLALLSPALALECRFVFNRTGLTTQGYMKTVCKSDEDSCVSSVLRTNIIKYKRQLSNQCSSSSHCYPGHFSFTGADGEFFELKTVCCKTQLCNNKTLSLADRNTFTENGLQCPSCFSKGNTMCKSEKTINCLENETQCLQFKGSVLDVSFKIYNFTFQGCGTKDMCDIGINGSRIEGVRFLLFVSEESCYNASQISHQPEQEAQMDPLLMHSKIHGNEEELEA